MYFLLKSDHFLNNQTSRYLCIIRDFDIGLNYFCVNFFLTRFYVSTSELHVYQKLTKTTRLFAFFKNQIRFLVTFGNFTLYEKHDHLMLMFGLQSPLDKPYLKTLFARMYCSLLYRFLYTACIALSVCVIQ